MNKSVYSISLDLHTIVAPKVLPIKQGDTARELRVTLAEDGAPYEITSDCSAVLCAELPDGSSVSQNMSSADNTLTADIPSSWTEAVGEVECEVMIIAATTGKTIRSPRFSFVVTESLASSLYDVYWDRCPNISSISLRGNRRKYVSDGNFDLTVTTSYAENTYAFVIIPEALAPENGLDVYAKGLSFTDQGIAALDSPNGRKNYRIFQSYLQVGNGIKVNVRKVS